MPAFSWAPLLRVAELFVEDAASPITTPEAVILVLAPSAVSVPWPILPMSNCVPLSVLPGCRSMLPWAPLPLPSTTLPVAVNALFFSITLPWPP